MNLGSGITTSFQGRPTYLCPNERLVSPISEKHFTFEFGQFLYTLNGLHVHLTPLQVAGYLSGNNATL